MKKIFSITAAIFCISIFTQAQTVRWGIDPGVAISKSTFTPFSGDRGTYIGFDGGGLVEIASKHFAFQVEVNYLMTGVKLSTTSQEYTIKHNFITVPLFLKYKFKGASLMTGPQMDFLLSAKSDTTNSTSADVKDQFKKSGFDWVFAGQINFPKNIFLGVRYSLGLTDYSERLNYQMKNRYFSIRIGYMFGK